MGLTIAGHGELIADGVSIGRAEYKIVVRITPRYKDASGVIWGDPITLNKAFESRDLRLVRDDNGFGVTIIVRSHNFFDNMAQIVVSGPPGPET